MATVTAVGMTDKGAETFLRLSVPRVNYQKENEDYVEMMNKREYDEKLSTSVTLLSDDEIDVNLRIEKILNKDQSVTQHTLE